MGSRTGTGSWRDIPGCNHYADSPKDVYTPLDKVGWRTIRCLDEFELELPLPLANWDVFASWERERFTSMRHHLTKGMVLVDVGAEQGWQSLIYNRFVGDGNMVLCEPTRELWPNIRATWERNGAHPRRCYDGLLSSETTDLRDTFTGWPPASQSGVLLDRNKYNYIHEHGLVTPQITVDDLMARCGVTPDAVTIDVEGAELAVLTGAEHTLAEHHPLVWVSIHPDLMVKHYRHTVDMLQTVMSRHGYRGKHVATDHEQHWIFR